MRFCAVIWLVLLFCAAAHPVKEVDDAAAFNTALAPALLDLGNHCGFPVSQPSVDDPYSYAGIKAVSMVPQVDNNTTDRADAKLIWSLGASYATYLHTQNANRGFCDPTEFTLSNPRNAKFIGTLQYSYGSQSQSVPLAVAGPNIVKLNLDSAALRDADFDTLAANLTVGLAGTMSVDYTYTKIEYVYHADDKGNQYCEPVTTVIDPKTYSKQLSDSRIFSVENGPVEEFWVNPPLEKRLEGDQSGEVIFFARRMPSEINASVNGVLLGENSPYKYIISTGVCGEQEVTSAFLPEGKNMIVNVSNQTYNPFQLVDKNATYLPFYAAFSWNETPGKKAMLLSSEDRFGFVDNFARDFSVRVPAPFSSGYITGEMATRKGSDTETPAAYPAPISESSSPPLAAIAIVFALPVAFGAIAVIGWMGKLRL